jgi:hypothetical protein
VARQTTTTSTHCSFREHGNPVDVMSHGEQYACQRSVWTTSGGTVGRLGTLLVAKIVLLLFFVIFFLDSCATSASCLPARHNTSDCVRRDFLFYSQRAIRRPIASSNSIACNRNTSRSAHLRCRVLLLQFSRLKTPPTSRTPSSTKDISSLL